MIFFFNDTATTEIYTYGHTLSLHDALPIYAQHEKGKSPRSDALEGGQPVRDLLIARAEAPLEQQQVVARRITGAQESAIRHNQRRRAILDQVTHDQLGRRAFREPGARDQRGEDRQRVGSGTSRSVR